MCAPWLALACALLTAAASAQTLDLGGSGASTTPDASEVWRERARDARERAASAEELERSLSQAAATLFDRARALGPAGSAHAVIGLSLEQIDPKTTPGRPARQLIVCALDRLAMSPPDDPGELARRVRAIAALAWTPEMAPSLEATLGSDIERWSARLDAETLGALRRLDAELLSIAIEPAMAPSVERTRRVVRQAARVLDIEPGKPLRDAFSVAIRRLAPGDGATGVARARSLAQLRALSRLADAHDALERVGADDASVRAWRNIAAGGPLGEDARRVSDNILGAETLREASGPVAGERDLLQPLRPAYRALVRERRDARERVMAALSRLAGEPDAIGDPGVAGVLAALRSLDASIDGVAALDQLCRAWSRADAPVSGARLSVRALELSRGLDRNASRVEFDQALARVRRLAADARRFGDLPGRAGLDGAAGEALGDQTPRLRAAMDRATGEVFKAWLEETSGETLTAARERAEAYAALADQIGSTRALRAPIRTSPPTHFDAVAVTERADRALRASVRAAIGGDTTRLARSLERTPPAVIVGRAIEVLSDDDASTGWGALAHAALWIEDEDRVRLARYASEMALAPHVDDALAAYVETLTLAVESR